MQLRPLVKRRRKGGRDHGGVLRQGLMRSHVLAVVLFCAVSDAVLIAAGVAGYGAATRAVPWLGEALRWAGVAFLTWYGLRSFLAALRGGGRLVAAGGAAAPLGPTLAALAAITWLNPHVWLDTVVLIGAVSGNWPGQETAFAAGAAAGSFLFFVALGFGARTLAPVFARPRAWVVLDLLIAGVMWWIAAGLAFG